MAVATPPGPAMPGSGTPEESAGALGKALVTRSLRFVAPEAQPRTGTSPSQPRTFRPSTLNPSTPISCARCGATEGRDIADGLCMACLLEDALPAAEGLTGLGGRPPAETDAPLRQRFGGYELLEEIGRGGMGVIYKAKQPGLDRLVALKMPSAGEFAEAKARERLLREAKMAAQLSHPHIVAIHEVGEHDGRPFFAMEYVAGCNLAQRCRDGLLPVATAVRYVEQIARAVHYAHQQGLVHRDLKPANVMIGPDDSPKLTDFGLTKSLVEPMGTIEHAGSPNFMAPEQADSTLGGTSPLTDVFGLGAILYFLLVGRPPAVGETLTETLRAVVACDPAPPRQLRPALPPDLETISLKCLEKDPSRRYGNALEVAEELARWRDHKPIRARPLGACGRFSRWSRRNPALAALLATALLALITITIQWRRTMASEYSARKNAYAAQMLLARQRYEAFNVAGARILLDELRPKEGGPDFRDFEWAHLYRLCHQETQVVSVDGRDVYTVAFSPSGRILAAGITPWRSPGAARIELFDPHTGKKLRDFSTGEAGFTFSPDGKWIVAWNSSNIVVRQFPEGAVVKVLPGHAGGTGGVAFSPNGRQMASVGADHKVRLWNVEDGSLVRTMEANSDRGPLAVAWDAAGARIFSAGDDGLVYIFDAGTGATLDVLHGHNGYIYCLAVSPTGQRLATGGADRRIRIWDTSTGRQVAELQGHESYVYSLRFSPDGAQLASAGWDNTLRLWNPDTGRQTRILRGSGSFVFSVAYSPDGKTLASGGHDGSIRFWNPEADSTEAVLRGASHPVGFIEWWPEGNWLLSLETMNATQHVYRVWDARTGRQTRTWEGPGGRHFLDGGRVLLSRPDDSVALYDPRTGIEEPVPKDAGPFFELRFSPDRTRVATSGVDGKAALWRELRKPPLLTAAIPRFDGQGGDFSVQFTPDGRRFVTTSPDSRIHVWDAGTGREVVSFPRPPPPQNPAQISPDSKLIAAMDGSVLTTWELETGRRRFVVEFHHQPASAGVFSPDSRSILVGHGALFDVYDASSGKLRHHLVGHSGVVLCAAYSPNGRRIATAGDDHTIKIWDAENGRELISLSGHDSETYCLSFSPDGQRLASCGADRTIRLYTAATGAEISHWEKRDQALAELGE